MVRQSTVRRRFGLAVRNFRRKDFSSYGNFAVQIFRGYEYQVYTFSGSSSLVNVFSILNRALTLIPYFSKFQVDPLSTKIFCFVEVKFPTKLGETVESTLNTGFCRSYLSRFGSVGKLNALIAIICGWLICALNMVYNSKRMVI